MSIAQAPTAARAPTRRPATRARRGGLRSRGREPGVLRLAERARLMERIGSKPTPQEAVLVRAGEDGWVQTPVPGVQTKSLYGKKTLLVRMAPKTTLPEHDHNAAEQCLVLEGSVTCDGVTAYAGDYTYIPAGTHHNALYSEEGCLLLIAYTS